MVAKAGKSNEPVLLDLRPPRIYIWHMKRRLGGFGLVMLLAVMLVVLLLVARSWRAVAPEAIDVTRPDRVTPKMAMDDPGGAAAEALRRGELPGLDEMQQRTDDHAEQVQDALANSE